MADAPIGSALSDALRRAMPGLLSVTIPGRVALAARNRQPLPRAVADSEAEARFAQTRLYGTIAGRAWQIKPPLAGATLLELTAQMRWAPAGREAERRLPWVVFGSLPGKLAMNRLSLAARLGLAAIERLSPGATRTVGHTPSGRPLVVAASFPGADAELRSPFWTSALQRWESVLGPSKFLDSRVAPILVGSFPHVTLYVEYDTAVPAAAYVEVATTLAAGLDRLEHGFSAPAASEEPIPTRVEDLIPGFPSPEPTPLYLCPKCGQLESTSRQLNKFRLLVGIITSGCKVPLFQSMAE